MWLDSKAVNCPQKWGNFRAAAVIFPVQAYTFMAFSAKLALCYIRHRGGFNISQKSDSPLTPVVATGFCV